MKKICLQILGMAVGGFILLVGLCYGILYLEGLNDETVFNDGKCTHCNENYEFSNVSKNNSGIEHYYYHCTGCGNVIDTVTPMEMKTEKIITVDDVASKAGTDYFIVKDVNNLVILEEDVYMDREVVEINICDDVENTLCLFIDLEENEIPRIRKN